MIWFAWLMLALESLAISISLWVMWVMISEAARAPADPFSAMESPTARPPAQVPERRLSQAQDDSALFTMEEVDERGYVSIRKLHMGCEAAVCRTPIGARIVAGRRSLKEAQYAWDYGSVRLAKKALLYAEFNTHPMDGIVGVEDFSRGCYPAAEPQDYLRRWRYTPDGRMESF